MNIFKKNIILEKNNVNIEVWLIYLPVLQAPLILLINKEINRIFFKNKNKEK